MSFVALDIRTLSFITVLFSFGVGAGLIAFGMVHRTFSGLKRVGMGLAYVGLGFLLIALRDHVSPALSVVAANTCLLLGFACMNHGIQSFRQVPHSDVLVSSAITAVNLAVFVTYTYLNPSVAQRILWISLSLAALSAMCCRSVLTKNARNVNTPQVVIAAAFGMCGVFMLVRAWWVLDETAMQSFMSAGTIHGLAFLAMILLELVVSFGLVWLANDRLFQELKQYERIISTTPDAIILMDREGRYRLVNDAMLNMLGVGMEDVLGKRSADLFGKDVYETVTLPNLKKVFKGQVGEACMWIESPSGERRYLALTYHPVPDAMGNNTFAAITARDMTELHFVQRERQRIFELSMDMLCIAGMDGYFKEINPAWTRILGWSEEELLQSKWIDFVHPEDVEETAVAGNLLAEGKQLMDFVNRYRRKDGTYKYLSWMSYPDIAAQLIYAVARDVTDWVRMEEELRELAATDPLTGADNRRTFMQRLEDEVERSVRYGIPLSLFILDIDYFKVINDGHGHAVGDAVLRSCVDTCKETLRSTDIFGRIGGEEFAVALPYTNLDTGCETAERLRKNLGQSVIETDDDPLQFTVSVGVVKLRPGESVEDFLKRADEALYRAKQGGRDRVEKG